MLLATPLRSGVALVSLLNHGLVMLDSGVGLESHPPCSGSSLRSTILCSEG